MKKFNLSDLSTYLFQREVSDKHWAFSMEYEPSYVEDGHLGSLILDLFKNMPAVCEGYSDAQIAQGLNYIINPSLSDLAFFFGGDVEYEITEKFLDSTLLVFKTVFAARLAPDNDEYDHDLSYVCKVWWDVLPYVCDMKPDIQRKILKKVLGILEQIIAMDSMVCRESALRGLESLSPYMAQECDRIIAEHASRLPKDLLALFNRDRYLH